MEAVLLGTGCPVVHPKRRGAATLIRQGSAQCLIDCGSGVTQRLVEAGTNGAEVAALLVTHLHTDHLVDFYQLITSSWHQGRDHPWEIYAPPPVIAHMREIMKAWEPERLQRIDFEQRASVDGFELDLHEIADGDVFRVGDIEVTTVEVNHGPVAPALGFVFETADSKLVHSGDTARSDRLIEVGQGADLLIHEVFLHRHMQPDSHRSSATVDNVASYHTLSSEVGGIAKEMDVDTLVLTHFVPPEFDRAALLMEVGHSFEGSVFIGEDLMRFDLLNGEVAWGEMRARVL